MADNRKLLVGPLGIESSSGTLNINNNLLSNLAAPQNDADAVNKNYVDLADAGLNERLLPIEERALVHQAIVYENNAQVYADGQPGTEDASLRPGWYYTNSVAGQKINWYFFDGINQANISLGNFSAWAVMTFDGIQSSPILAVYTMPTGSGDIIPGFAHSRKVFSAPSPTPVVGTKYLVYFGQNPPVHPELPRIELGYSAGSSGGDMNPSEQVLTCSFGSNSAAAVGNVKFMVESLGVESPNYRGEALLQIRGASIRYVDNALTSYLKHDGTVAMTGQLDMNTHKIINVVAGVADNDVVIMSQYNDLDGYAQDIRSDLDDLDGYAQDIRSDLDQEILDREAADLLKLNLSGGTMSGAINMGSNKITNLAAGVDATDAVNVSQLSSSIGTIGNDFWVDEFTVDAGMISNGYIDLSAKAYPDSMIMSIGRLLFFGNGVDYSVSVVGGVTRLTFVGDLLPGQAEALEVGEKIKVRYLKDLR